MEIYEAAPISRSDLRKITNSMRELVGLKDERYFPITEFLECVMPQLDHEFVYDIAPKQEMGSNHGLTFPEKKLIQIREDVYEQALAGKGRDRLTIAHEIGHYFLHTPKRISLARNRGPATPIPIYMEPEWQANAFAGELLAPPHIIRGMSVFEVARFCGVSEDAARKQLKSMNR